MPQISPELANGLYRMDVSSVSYIVNQHKNLSGLLLNMQPRTLEYVFNNVPSIGRKVAQLSPEDLQAVIRNLPDITAFLKRLDSKALEQILSKMPSLKGLAPGLNPKPASGTKKPCILFKKMELEKIRTRIPKIDELISKVPSIRQFLLRKRYPYIATAIMKLNSDDLRILNANINTIANQLNKLAVKGFSGNVSDKRDENILRKILLFTP